MNDLFVDTSGFGHLLDSTQVHHLRATEIYRAAVASKHRIVTTNYVMTELVALLHSPLRIARSNAVEMLEAVLQSPHIEIIHIDRALDSAAWQLLKARTDKSWSLVDCASFVVMQEQKLTDALTTYHHFEQAGFVRLLR